MKKNDFNKFVDIVDVESDLFDDLDLTERDFDILDQLDDEIEETLKKIRIYDLQTNSQMSDLLSKEISKQGDRINGLMDKASPALKQYLIDRMKKIKDTYLN